MKAEHWSAWLRAALWIGLKPRDFWRLSYREWRLLAEARTSGLARADFDAMARAYPDS